MADSTTPAPACTRSAAPDRHPPKGAVDESFVVLAGRVFRYPMGDQEGRAAGEAHAREHGVPEPQIDWP